MVVFYYKDSVHKYTLDLLRSVRDYDKNSQIFNDFFNDKIARITYNEPLELELLQDMFAVKLAQFTSMFYFLIDEINNESEDYI